MIQINDVEKRYPHHTVKYNSIIIDNKCTIILGENGKGKTTLLQAIASLISYQGEIILDDSVIYIPDQIDVPYDVSLLEWLNVVFPNTIKRKKWSELFSLTSHLQKQCHELSNGMKQKCKLLFAILLNQRIVLLDEPFVGLDDDAIHTLIQWIQTTEKQIVIATHQPQLLSSIKTAVISL